MIALAVVLLLQTKSVFTLSTLTKKKKKKSLEHIHAENGKKALEDGQLIGWLICGRYGDTFLK